MSAAEHAAGPANSTEYIAHHLTHLKVGEGFWSLHVDTIFMSVLLGLVTLAIFYPAARKATGRRPRQMADLHRDGHRGGRHHRQGSFSPRSLVSGPPRPHYLRVGAPDEHDGPAAARPARQGRGPVRHPLLARGADGRRQHDVRDVADRAARRPVLQLQGQGRGRLRPRAVHGAVRQPIRSCGSRTSC